jgi:hypothetical protein
MLKEEKPKHKNDSRDSGSTIVAYIFACISVIILMTLACIMYILIYKPVLWIGS